jgi:hypothetical protein
MSKPKLIPTRAEAHRITLKSVDDALGNLNRIRMVITALEDAEAMLEDQYTRAEPATHLNALQASLTEGLKYCRLQYVATTVRAFGVSPAGTTAVAEAPAPSAPDTELAALTAESLP